MKKILIAFVVLPSFSFADTVPNVLSMQVSNRRPVQLQTNTNHALATYAESNSYTATVNLQEGMKVLYSASYGIGGEAAQASGVIVVRNGRHYFRQTAMPSTNLLLAPGMGHSMQGDSLWDLDEYMDLINRVAFSQKNTSFETSNDVYSKPDASLVDFRGGTAGQSVFYKDALEVGYNIAWNRAATTKWTVYYGKDIGPVALEFRENTDNPCTFKFYIGK